MKKTYIQQEAEHIHLSINEKGQIRGRFQVLIHDVSAVRKTNTQRYSTHATASRLSLLYNLCIRPMAITLIITILLGGSASFAAERALPGDALYPVKIEMNERVRAWAAVSNEAQAEWQTRVVERRLEEAETLAAENRLTIDARSRIEANFEEHADRVEERIAALEASNNSTAAADVSSKFEVSLQAHANILERLRGDTEESVQAEIKPLIGKVRARVEEAARSRQNAEIRIATSTSADVKVAAEGKQKAAEHKIEEVRTFIERSSISAEMKAKAEAQLELAATAIAGGKAKMELKLYNEAFLFFQKAHRLAQEAKLLLEAQIRLPIELKIDIRANQETETHNAMEANEKTEIRVGGSSKTEAGMDGGNVGVESETRGTTEIEIGL